MLGERVFRQHAVGYSALVAPEGFGRKDFENAGIRTVERCFKARDLIFAPGDPDNQLFFLLEGTIRLYKLYGEFKEATTALLKDHGVFGRLSLAEDQWQDGFAEAVTDVRVAGVRKSALTEAIRRDPRLAIALFACFSERLTRSDEVIESLLPREVSMRLATLLLKLAERFGQSNGSGVVLGVHLTHQELANMIASTREAVSKVMSEFQRQGAIEVHNRKITIYSKLAKMRGCG
jgi:CRP/FNR family transcriptional regulator, global nitrogen regulator